MRFSTRSISQWVTRWLEHLQPSPSVVLGAAAVLVGLSSGMGVWLFKALIGWVEQLAFEDMLGFWGGGKTWLVAFVPVLGGLAAGLMMHFLVGVERHHGVAGIMEAVALAGGRLRYKRVPAKAVAAAISIGSGASVGPEDPSVQIGANLGSFLGQTLRLSDERVRSLVAAGAAGGIAAAFNAPIAGVFFAMEIVLGELGGGALGAVLVAAVVSAVFTQAVEGASPAFAVPAYAFNSVWELPLYLVLGLLAGPLAAVYIRLLYFFQDLFRGWGAPRWLKPAVAGLGVGLVGLALPQVFGVGYATIEGVLNWQNLALGLLLALLAAKLLLTPLCIGAGFPGGVFAPSLFLGAMLGAALGLAADWLFPSLGIAPPAFAMVGMAAVLAGAVHAPLTAILLLFEMTHDYRIILPLMLAVTISLLLSQRLVGDSVYTLGLTRKGIRLERGRDVDVMEAVQVGDVMLHETFALPLDFPVPLLAERFLQTGRHGFAVAGPDGSLYGIVSVDDYRRALTGEHGAVEQLTVREIATRDLITAFPDETVGVALRRMSPRDLSRLPVVARDDPRRLLGMVRRSDIVRAYDVALSRRAALRHRVHQVRLDALTPELANVIEVLIQPGAVCDGKQMKDVSWPRDSIVASLRRGGRLIVPRGDTVLQAGDVLVVVAEENARLGVDALCGAKPVDPQG